MPSPAPILWHFLRRHLRHFHRRRHSCRHRSSGTQIVDVANITSGTNDPNLANNTAIAITTVGATGTADLAITNAPSSLTVTAGSNVTLTGVITNLGPSAAAGPVFTEAIPANTTLCPSPVPARAGAATTPRRRHGTVKCVDNSPLALNANATFSFVVNVPAPPRPAP